MCPFLEILRVKKCRDLSVWGGGEYFPIRVNIFPIPKIWNYLLVLVAFAENIMGNSFY